MSEKRKYLLKNGLILIGITFLAILIVGLILLLLGLNEEFYSTNSTVRAIFKVITYYYLLLSLSTNSLLCLISYIFLWWPSTIIWLLFVICDHYLLLTVKFNNHLNYRILVIFHVVRFSEEPLNKWIILLQLLLCNPISTPLLR